MQIYLEKSCISIEIIINTILQLNVAQSHSKLIPTLSQSQIEPRTHRVDVFRYLHLHPTRFRTASKHSSDANGQTILLLSLISCLSAQHSPFLNGCPIDRLLLLGTGVNGVQEGFLELELGEFGHVHAGTTAELLGDALQLGLELAFRLGSGVHQTAVPANQFDLLFIYRSYGKQTLTSTWFCIRGSSRGTAAGSGR